MKRAIRTMHSFDNETLTMFSDGAYVKLDLGFTQLTRASNTALIDSKYGFILAAEGSEGSTTADSRSKVSLVVARPECPSELYDLITLQSGMNHDPCMLFVSKAYRFNRT